MKVGAALRRPAGRNLGLGCQLALGAALPGPPRESPRQAKDRRDQPKSDYDDHAERPPQIGAAVCTTRTGALLLGSRLAWHELHVLCEYRDRLRRLP